MSKAQPSSAVAKGSRRSQCDGIGFNNSEQGDVELTEVTEDGIVMKVASGWGRFQEREHLRIVVDAELVQVRIGGAVGAAGKIKVPVIDVSAGGILLARAFPLELGHQFWT